MSLGRAEHQKPGQPGRAEIGQGEALLGIGRDEARLARPEPEGLGEPTCLRRHSRERTWSWRGNVSRPIAAVLGWMD